MEESDDCIERVVRRLQEEMPLRKCDARVYAARAREYCLEIQKMRSEGFSYMQICGAFEKEKLLPANPKINSFRQACRRELIRQKKENGHPALLNSTKQIAKKLDIKSGKAVATQKTDDGDQRALEIERRKKLLANENYVNKAPKNIVELDREKLKEEEEKLSLLKNK